MNEKDPATHPMFARSRTKIVMRRKNERITPFGTFGETAEQWRDPLP
jgi:hypothetical protein